VIQLVRPGGGNAEAGDALVASTPASGLMPSASDFALVMRRLAEAPDFTRVAGAGPRVPENLLFATFLQQGAGEFELTGLNGFDVGNARFTLEEFQQSLRSGLFIEELNQLRNQLREEFDLDRILSVSVGGLWLGASVAYVLWLVRGGVLVGSYLSALPAWRLLDPLPVLGRLGEDEEDEEEDAFDAQPGKGADPLRGFS
jgi:hypothetical protein